MDVMNLRRNLLMMQESGLDTSPRIAYDGYKVVYNEIREDDTSCVSDFYSYPMQNFAQVVVGYGVGTVIAVYTDDTYIDWWSIYARANESTKDALNAGTNRMRITIVKSLIDDCYLYLRDTGQILFAGKNSIYYGHRNISELN